MNSSEIEVVELTSKLIYKQISDWDSNETIEKLIKPYYEAFDMIFSSFEKYISSEDTPLIFLYYTLAYLKPEMEYENWINKVHILREICKKKYYK